MAVLLPLLAGVWQGLQSLVLRWSLPLSQTDSDSSTCLGTERLLEGSLLFWALLRAEDCRRRTPWFIAAKAAVEPYHPHGAEPHSTLGATRSKSTMKEVMNNTEPVSASPSRATKSRRRRRVLWILIGFASMCVLAGLAAFVYVTGVLNSFDSKSATIPSAFPDDKDRPQATRAGDQAAVNLLLVGSDSRGATRDQAESGSSSDQRADSLMLYHLTADRKNSYLISIMRDSWVSIPGHGEAKINAALSYGGVPLLVQTVESVLQQRIDHVAFIDFEGFKGLTDAVGGVDVDVPVAFTSTGYGKGGTHYPQGIMHMDGATAIAFVRERYGFIDGDYQRVRDQRIFLNALMGKLATPEVLANPQNVSSMINEISPYITVDSSLTGQRIGEIAFGLRNLRPSSTMMLTLPTLGTGWSSDGQSIVKLDTAKVEALSTSLKDGTTADFVEKNGLKNGN